MRMPGDNNGVGGRHRSTPSPARGGGYQDIYRDLRTALCAARENCARGADVTIDDLRALGLSGKWLEIAERVGPETWLQIWEILDRENIDQPPPCRDRIRMWVPSYSKFLKFVRNRTIFQLAKDGHAPDAISRAIGKTGFDPVSPDQVRKIIAGSTQTGPYLSQLAARTSKNGKTSS